MDEQHAVLAFIMPDLTVSRYEDWSVDELEEQLEEDITQADAGTLDGHELGEGQLIVFMYGPDADCLGDVVCKCLKGFPMGPGSYLIKRYGEPGAPEERVAL